MPVAKESRREKPGHFLLVVQKLQTDETFIPQGGTQGNDYKVTVIANPVLWDEAICIRLLCRQKTDSS